jgi:DNA-directed RNA polymerase specialized sigma24 family protein
VPVNAQGLLAELLEARRARLWAVGYRMLGSSGDAEGAVQETWLRLSAQMLTGWATSTQGRPPWWYGSA